MGKLRGITLALLLLGVSLFAVSSASAFKKPKNLFLQTAKGVLVPGQEVALSSSELAFENSGGLRLECSHATLTGTLTINDAQVVTVSFTEGSFWSDLELGCQRLQPLIQPVEYSRLVPAALPWTASFSYKGTVAIAGTEGVALEVLEPAPGTNRCRYVGKSLKGSLQRAIPQADVMMPYPLEKLAIARNQPCRGKGPGYVTKATMRATWYLSSEGEPVEAKIGL